MFFDLHIHCRSYGCHTSFCLISVKLKKVDIHTISNRVATSLHINRASLVYIIILLQLHIYHCLMEIECIDV
jgi:hypothetical protein